MPDMKVDVKHCVSCGEDKPETEFSLKRPGCLQSRCKACQRGYSKEWYEKNRATVAPKIAAHKAATQPVLLALVEKHVATTPCSTCGKKRAPFVDLFVNGTRRTPKQLVYAGYSKASLQAALAQATVVCSLCRHDAERLIQQTEQARFEAERAALPQWRRSFQEAELLAALDPLWVEMPVRVPAHSHWIEHYHYEVESNTVEFIIREDAVFWMPRTDSVQSYVKLLHPGSFEEPFVTKGLLTTCGAFWVARGDLDRLAATWILALDAEFESSRTRLTWPLKARDALTELAEVAKTVLGDVSPFWHYAMTRVLPGSSGVLSRWVPPEDAYSVMQVIRDFAYIAQGSGQYVHLVQQETP